MRGRGIVDVCSTVKSISLTSMSAYINYKNRVREAHRNASSSPELCVGALRRRLLLLCLGRDELAALVPEVATMVA